jgi:uncharacterized protein (TIRG00374 family)
MTELAAEARPRLPLRRRRWVRRSLQLLVVAVIVWWLVVPQLAASRGSFHLLFDFDSPWLGLATLAELASLVVFALATRTLLARPTRPSTHRVLRIDLSTIALSHCLPGGGAAGTALGTQLLTRAGVPGADALFTKLAQGIGSAVVLQGLLVATLTARLLQPHPSQWEVVLVAVELGAFLILSACAALARVARRRRPTRVRPARVVGPRLTVLLAWGRAAQQLAQQLSLLRADPRRVVVAVAWATANWLLDAAALWAALRVYGKPLPIDGVLIAFALANTVAWLPISPSGLGVADALLIPALIAFGAGHTDAVLGVITWRLLSFWLPIPLGLASYGSLHFEHRRHGRLAAAAQQAGRLAAPEPSGT